jgi:uncharacterized cupin superfamily protein
MGYSLVSEDAMKTIDLETLPVRSGSGYPPPYNAKCLERTRRQLGEAAGLSQFGVNLLRLPDGQWSSQRHWHSHEDEFVWVVEGEVMLVTDAGEEILRAGDCAGFKTGERNGHHLQNRSGRDAVLLEVGSRSIEDACDYPDLDMIVGPGDESYRHRDGTPY